jgi:hypothetical protein
MFDYTALFEFSRNHCVAICAFLVPANLLTTLGTLVLSARNRPLRQIFAVAAIALFWAGLMVLHVMTWFLIGVVMAPTFVLLGLGSVCLVINLWAVLNQANLRHLLSAIGRIWVYIRSALSSQLT